MHSGFHDKGYLIKYSKTEDELKLENIKHPIIREVFICMELMELTFRVQLISQLNRTWIFSAFTCGIINLCQSFKGIKSTQEEIAKIACDVEINRLKEQIGKQDQYGCALPGLKKLNFSKMEMLKLLP